MLLQTRLAVRELNAGVLSTVCVSFLPISSIREAGFAVKESRSTNRNGSRKRHNRGNSLLRKISWLVNQNCWDWTLHLGHLLESLPAMIMLLHVGCVL